MIVPERERERALGYRYRAQQQQQPSRCPFASRARWPGTWRFWRRCNLNNALRYKSFLFVCFFKQHKGLASLRSGLLRVAPLMFSGCSGAPAIPMRGYLGAKSKPANAH